MKSDDHLHREASSWILLQHVKTSGMLDETAYDSMAARLDQYTDWPTRLHVCQIASIAPPPQQLCGRFARWLEPLLSHDRPFLRAWSLSALVRIAESDESFSAQAQEALSRASADKAASVKARARKLS